MKDDQRAEECMSRRHFVFLTASAALAGCQTTTGGAGGANKVVDAGPAAKYAADGVYSGFRDEGFFLVRKEGKLTAISSICTHRKCRIDAEPDRTFYCPCHGSTFDPKGKVTEGPAKRDLPVLTISTSPAGHVLVTVPVV